MNKNASADKLEKMLSEIGINAHVFAQNIGMQYQRIFDIKRGRTKKISGEIANAISLKYPQYPIEWLLSDDKKILGSLQIVSQDNSSGNIVATNDSVTSNDTDILIDLLKKKDEQMMELLQKKDEQISKLIDLLEKK